MSRHTTAAEARCPRPPPGPVMPTRWITTRAAVLIEQTAALGMTLDEAAAETVIQDRLRALAAAMRVTVATARRYLDDDTIRELASTMVAHPTVGQPLQLPRPGRRRGGVVNPARTVSDTPLVCSSRRA